MWHSTGNTHTESVLNSEEYLGESDACMGSPCHIFDFLWRWLGHVVFPPSCTQKIWCWPLVWFFLDFLSSHHLSRRVNKSITSTELNKIMLYKCVQWHHINLHQAQLLLIHPKYMFLMRFQQLTCQTILCGINFDMSESFLRVCEPKIVIFYCRP